MNSRPEEIGEIIRDQIKNYRSKVEMTETGRVILVGDGIARVYGLRSCMANELLEFDDGSFGMAQNLENETVSVAVLSDDNSIREGTEVRRTGRRQRSRSADRRQGRDKVRGRETYRIPRSRHHREKKRLGAAPDRHQGHRLNDSDRPRSA